MDVVLVFGETRPAGIWKFEAAAAAAAAAAVEAEVFDVVAVVTGFSPATDVVEPLLLLFNIKILFNKI